MKYILVGNPNVGKSTLYNALTKSSTVVGNFPGVTVEKKIGKLVKSQGSLIDLPGIYSLAPSSLDEGVSSDVLLDQDYAGIINILDSTSLKRNLHLTLQLLELGKPMVIVNNLKNEANSLGIKINTKKMSEILGVDVLNASANTLEGIEEINESLKNLKTPKSKVDYGEIVEEFIHKIRKLIPHDKNKRRFLALSCLEKNEKILDYLQKYGKNTEILQLVNQCEEQVVVLGEAKNLKMYLFHRRRIFIEKIANECVTFESTITELKDHKIDKILTHKILGVLTFLLILFTIYKITFDLIGNPLSDYLDTLINQTDKKETLISNFFNIFGIENMTNLYSVATEFLKTIGVNGLAYSLLIDGVYSGVGSIIIFVPQIAILFFLLTFLDSVGYFSRVALLFDHLFMKIGLSGKSLVPLITGVGCNVPAVLSTRIIESKKERLMTILLVPFMSCSARIPIYLIFVNVFFPKQQAVMLLILQMIGAIVAVALAAILNSSVFKKQKSNLLIEIPPYRLPKLSYLIRITFEKVKDFLKGAGKYIVIGTILVWFLTTFSFTGLALEQEDSILAFIGKSIAPLFNPIGFGNWQSMSALISGFMAKEMVVASLPIIYGVSSDALDQNMLLHFTQASALSFVVFNALYVPCIATIFVIKQEAGTKWMWFSIFLSLAVAYVVSLLVYLIGLAIF